MVPQNYKTVNGKALGSWVTTQRNKKSKKLIRQDRVELLESLTGWSWNSIESKWLLGFEALQNYIKNRGDSRPVDKFIDEKGYPIGSWVMTQRANKLKGILNKKQIEMLESLPQWAWDLRYEIWEEGFREVLQYVAQNGNANINKEYITENGIALGNWVSFQRANKVRGILDDKRIARLESIPTWSWNALDKIWDESFTEMQTYFKQYGNAKIPQKYISPNGLRLGIWVSRQRQYYLNKQLSKERIAKLEALNGWVWTIKNKNKFSLGSFIRSL